MATEVDWNNVGGKDREKTRFVKFTDGKTVNCRPIGTVVEFIKFFIKSPNGNRSICVELADADQAATVLSQHSGQQYTPQHRYAMNVLNREDGQIYVLEVGSSIFKHFANWATAAKQQPGSNAGGDWSIYAEGNGKQRRYTTTFIKNTPVVEAERKTIKEAGGVYTLKGEKSVFPSVPLDQLIEKAFGESSGQPATTPATEPASEPQAATTAVMNDDPINW
ncbi:hypothetical protein LCGC14_0834590 [marine sediment metagenome]|uniref:Uncharacterized protein n=1 Tax=marine sediment metagenome TaxID=412755 RepID=A0A0F9RZP3_9ZZZZ